MSEEILPGGNTDGAVRIGGVVYKRALPWTLSVHALLRYLEEAGVDGVPRTLGFDDQGRQMLTYLPGEVIGDSSPLARLGVRGLDAGPGGPVDAADP